MMNDDTQEASGTRDGQVRPEFVRLWDGKRYSTHSVDADLAAYALEHPVLVERMPNMRRRYARGFAQFSILTGFLLWGFLLLAGLSNDWPEGRLSAALATAFVGAVCTVPLTVFIWFRTLMHFPGYRPTVSVQDGHIWVKTGNRILREPLGNCFWFNGRISNMCLGRRDTNFLRDSTIIVELRRRTWRDPGVAVAVGFTSESRSIWEAFLTLAEVPRNTRREPRAGMFRHHACIDNPGKLR